MIKISPPFKGAKPNNITQGFSEAHKANDWASYYGTPLCAPFNAKIAVIMTAENIDKGYELERGYGIRLVSIEDPTISMTYWHCQPFFPVNVGDTVYQGDVVAFMGNSGFVMSNGTYVEIDIRTVPPYKGTHTHLSISQNDVLFDFSQHVDYLIPVNYDIRTSVGVVLRKISNFLTNK